MLPFCSWRIFQIQVRLLTLHGRLKMGFRNASGKEVAFDTLLPETSGVPYANLGTPRSGDRVGKQSLNDQAYIDVTITGVPSGSNLDVNSVTDVAAEFTVETTDGFVVDESQAPVWISDTTFRYFGTGDLCVADAQQRAH